jgi:hypothetical protein
MGPPPARRAKPGSSSSTAGSAPARGLSSMYKELAVPKDEVSRLHASRRKLLVPQGRPLHD